MLFQKKKIAICIGIFVGSSWLGAQAQTVTPKDYGQRIGDVIVSATRSGTELKDMTQNTSVITNEDIQNAPNQTIDQILKNQSSVFLNDQPYYEKDPTGQSINVRGLGNARTLVLIDGVPANDAMYGTVQWNLVPLSAIEDVEFIRGGVSNLYGNYGMGGVINIKTKKINESGGEVSASYGTFNTSNVAASKDFKVNDVLNLRVSADLFNTDGYVQAATIYPATTYPNRLKINGSYQNAPLLPGMGPEAAKSGNYRLEGNLKLSGDTNGFFNLGYHTMSNLTPGGYSGITKSTEESTFSGGVKTLLDANSDVKVNAFYEKTSLWQQNASNPTSSTTGLVTGPYYIGSNYNDPYYTLGASAQYTNNLNMPLLDQAIFSVDARQNSASNYSNTLSSTGSSIGTAYAQGQQQFYGVMGQIKSKAEVIPLEATLAVRVDQYQSQVPTYWSGGANGANPLNTNAPNVSATKLSPNFGLLYQATKELDFRGAVYQGFHAPGLNNLIRSYGAPGTNYSFSNPALTPENMFGYELGSDYRWGAGFVQITGYVAQVSNAVVATTMTPGSATWNSVCSPALNCGAQSTIYSNSQSLQSSGLEFQAHYDISSKWATDGTFTHTNTVLTWLGAGVNPTLNPTGSQLGGVPQNMGTVALTYYPTSKANITANVRYIGNSWLDTQHTLPVPSYATIGAKANYEITPGTTMFLSVVNLLNRNYISYAAATSQTGYIVGQPQTVTVGARVVF